MLGLSVDTTMQRGRKRGAVKSPADKRQEKRRPATANTLQQLKNNIQLAGHVEGNFFPFWLTFLSFKHRNFSKNFIHSEKQKDKGG